jgi:hypothetical protein
LRRAFTKMMEESTFAAPAASHIKKKKHKRAITPLTKLTKRLFRWRLSTIVLLLSSGRIAFPTLASKNRKSDL